MKEKHGEGLHYPEEPRIFAMFFMVLDLRLVKIGCRDDNQFFLYLCEKRVFSFSTTLFCIIRKADDFHRDI